MVSEISVEFQSTSPSPYFAEGEKHFGVFSSKKLFFSIGKKEGGLTVLLPPPLFLQNFGRKGGGAVDWNSTDMVKHTC